MALIPSPGTSRQTLTRLRIMSEWFSERRHPHGALIDVFTFDQNNKLHNKIFLRYLSLKNLGKISDIIF